jgi:hypothetical protein
MKPLNQSKMKTAIEWYTSKLEELDIEVPYMVYAEAKEMEKENIINVLIGLGWTSEKAEQYYNETFKSE